MSTVIAMLLLAAVCWVYRIMLIVVVPADRLPQRAQQALGYLAPAVLAALVAVEADSATRGSDPGPAVLAVGALVLAGVAVRLTGNLLFAIGIAGSAVLVMDLVVFV